MNRKILETVLEVIFGVVVIFIASIPALIVILHDIEHAAK